MSRVFRLGDVCSTFCRCRVLRVAGELVTQARSSQRSSRSRRSPPELNLEKLRRRHPCRLQRRPTRRRPLRQSHRLHRLRPRFRSVRCRPGLVPPPSRSSQSRRHRRHRHAVRAATRLEKHRDPLAETRRHSGSRRAIGISCSKATPKLQSVSYPNSTASGSGPGGFGEVTLTRYLAPIVDDDAPRSPARLPSARELRLRSVRVRWFGDELHPRQRPLQRLRAGAGGRPRHLREPSLRAHGFVRVRLRRHPRQGARYPRVPHQVSSLLPEGRLRGARRRYPARLQLFLRRRHQRQRRPLRSRASAALGQARARGSRPSSIAGSPFTSGARPSTRAAAARPRSRSTRRRTSGSSSAASGTPASSSSTTRRATTTMAATSAPAIGSPRGCVFFWSTSSQEPISQRSSTSPAATPRSETSSTRGSSFACLNRGRRSRARAPAGARGSARSRRGR